MLERWGRGKITQTLEPKPAAALAAFSGSSLELVFSAGSEEGDGLGTGVSTAADVAEFVFSAMRTIY